MDISRTHLRQILGSIGRQHDAAMKLQDEAFDRAMNDDDLTPEGKHQLFLGGLDRRRFLTIGGVSVAGAAVFAACGSSSKSKTGSKTNTGNTGSKSTSSATTTDIVIFRTASSLEHLAVDTYEKAIKSGLVTTAAVVAAAKDFKAQHAQHAAAFEGYTTKAGGTPFTKANPAVAKSVIDPALAKLKTQTDVIELAYTLETAAGATYASTVGVLSMPAYNSAAASVAGVETRHVALLGLVLATPSTYPSYAPTGFLDLTKAVPAGTGVGMGTS